MPGLLGTGTVSAQRGDPVEAEPAVIESVCVNRLTGAVLDASKGCSSYEVLVTLPGDPPAAFCAHNHTGVLRYVSPNATCRSHETAVSLDSASDVTVCINNLNRVLRKASRAGTCQPHETVAIIGSGVTPTGCVFDEVEPNDEPETAMDLDGYTWCLDENPNITFSTILPHITINGTGDDTFDAYKFTIAEAGTTAVFDIDFGWTSPCETVEDPCEDFDSYIGVGVEEFPLAYNDDGLVLDPGSEDSYNLDSFLVYAFDEPGVYYLQIFDLVNFDIPEGETYQLHISIGASSDLIETCSIDEVEPNDAPGSAMDLNAGEWCLDENLIITDSTTVPHITVNGTGDDTTDIYAITIPTAGTTATFDIDFGWTDPCPDNSPCEDLDSYLTLYDSSFSEIDSNDDADVEDPGSEASDGLDSYLTYTFDTPGTYFIEVDSYSGSGVPDGETYQLHVSIEGHSVP